MKNIIADLTEFSKRLIVPSRNGGVHSLEKQIVKADFSVVVAICTHRDVKLQVFNLIRSLEQCPNPKIQIATAIGDALIDRSRSTIASTFLRDRSEDILWFIDDDIVTNSLDVTRLMWQMHKLDLDILAAPYPLKSVEDGKFAVRTLEDKTEFVVGKGAEIHPMRYVSTGCMGIKRKVLQKMVESEVVHLCHPDTKKFYPFFCPMEYKLNDKWIYLSEDWAFCQRALDLGFKVWCDFSVKLGHIGQYEFTFEDFFREPKKLMDGFNYHVDIKSE
jgi:hypothetical protein